VNPEEQAFLAGIAADPDADAPRLAFADYLQERGDEPRAEFVRRQVANARERPGTWEAVKTDAGFWGGSEAFDKLHAREPWTHPLVTEHAALVVLTLGGDRLNYSTCIGYYRGFPALVACTERTWHRRHRWFRVPVELLAVRAMGWPGVWRIEYRAKTDDFRYHSTLDDSVTFDERERHANPLRLIRRAFPNVRTAEVDYGRGNVTMFFNTLEIRSLLAHSPD